MLCDTRVSRKQLPIPFAAACQLTRPFPYSDVCTKYQEAAKIVNLALQGLVAQCKPGAKILDLCEFGHTVINTSAAKLFTKKVNGQSIERGVAFPVCISVNDCICNYSPLPEEERVRSIYSTALWIFVLLQTLSCRVVSKCSTMVRRSQPCLWAGKGVIFLVFREMGAH